MLSVWNPFLVPVKSDRKMSSKSFLEKLFEETIFTDMFGTMGIEHVKNEDGTLSVLVDVPGMKESDISIEVADGMVYVKGERKTSGSVSKMQRSFSLPENCDANNIGASLADGVLKFTLTKKLTSPKEVKKIEISTTEDK